MLGVIGVLGTCAAVVAVSVHSGLARYDRRECQVLRECLATGVVATSTALQVSRPARLLDAVRDARREPARVVNVLNETLGDVDFETRGGREVFRSCSRIAVSTGVAGACVEIALHSMSVGATVFALTAVAIGVAGGASCAVIGQWATRGAVARRQLWDEFVRWLLNSELQQTAWTLRGSGMRPTHDVENGQGS